MKTLAAVLTQLNAPLEMQELEIPPLQEGQVLVEIAYSGICHSQLNEILGLKGEDKYLPHTLGHEGAGTVLEVGPKVAKVRPGDPVVLSWIKGSGANAPGSIYRNRAGAHVNSGAISTFLQKAIVSENRLIPLPKAMPLREAALLGCAIPTGAGAIFHQMQVKRGNSLAIFGVGGIGMSALVAAASVQAEPLIAIDIHCDKLERAKACGATHVVNGQKGDPLSWILEITGGCGLDYAFESVGRKEVMELAFRCLKAPGGLCVLAGNLPQGQKIEIDPFDLIRGKQIVGTWGGGSQIDRDVAHYTTLFLEGRLPLQQLITHEAPLHQINELFVDLQAGKVGRALVVL